MFPNGTEFIDTANSSISQYERPSLQVPLTRILNNRMIDIKVIAKALHYNIQVKYSLEQNWFEMV